jgi:DNA-binding transcriptional LysR family regulator
MKLDPRHLEMLFAIVEKGGLSEGAEMLGKSQPSLSRSLSMLEDRIGIALFEPDRRPLRPTELGLALAAEGRKIYQAGRSSSEVLTLVPQWPDRCRSRGRHTVFPGWRDFRHASCVPVRTPGCPHRPDLRLYERAAPTAHGRVTGSGHPADARLVYPRRVRVRTDPAGRNVIACRAGHPLHGVGSVKLADIGQYPWIAPPADSPLYQDLRNVLKEIGIKDFKVSFTGGSLSATVNILTGSDALTVLPFSVVFMMRNQRSISALSIRIGDPDRHLGVLTNGDIRLKPAARRVRNHIRQEFEGSGPARS